MPLVDFVWDDKVSMKDGVSVIAGTAKDENGHIVDVSISVEALELLDQRDKKACAS